MKTILTIVILLTSLSINAQSFFHKKMKKVNKRPFIAQCETMQPKTTISHKINQKVLYSKKRKQWR